jgi:hypothetical protein
MIGLGGAMLSGQDGGFKGRYQPMRGFKYPRSVERSVEATMNCANSDRTG